MYQSSTRNNFLDTLLDPTAIAILASIALHATIGASLPLFTQPETEGKKVGPSTVKVVQLTPSELQRIPQAPPVPTAQVLPPVTQPIPSPRPSVAPVRPPEFSTAPQTIPFSPIRGAFDGVTIKPPAGKKQQPVKPRKPPIAAIFDPESIFKPDPKPSKPPIKKGITTKPSTQPTPSKKKPLAKKPQAPVTPTPQPNAVKDDDGGKQQPTTPASSPTQPAQRSSGTSQSSSPTQAAQQSSGTSQSSSPTQAAQQSSGTSQSSSPTQAAQQSSGTSQSSRPTATRTSVPTPPSDSTSGGSGYFYGKYTKSATERLQQYITAYPELKPYQPKLLSQSYPPGVACSKVKQPPFIVLMVAFGKVPENQEDNVLGESTAQPIDKPFVAGDRDTPENRKLGELAVNAALYDANKADQNRPAADKGKQVLYQYRVQFDPTTCKN